MSMSRKHYIRMAESIRLVLSCGDTITLSHYSTSPKYRLARSMANSFIDLAVSDNSAFNKQRFLLACGFTRESTNGEV